MVLESRKFVFYCRLVKEPKFIVVGYMLAVRLALWEIKSVIKSVIKKLNKFVLFGLYNKSNARRLEDMNVIFLR